MHPRHLRLPLRRLALMAPIFVLAGCGEKRQSAEWWEGERERISLTQTLELQEFRFRQTAPDESRELAALRERTAAGQKTAAALRERRQALAEELAALESGWETFRAAVLRERRQQAQGVEFPMLTATDGRSFADVRVTGIDDSGVAIRHADGAARLRFGELSAEQRVFFGLEHDLAVAAISREREVTAAYEREVDTQIAALDAERAREAAAARREEAALRASRLALRTQLLAVTSARPLNQPARTFSRSSRNNFYSTYWDGYRGYSRYGNYRNYQPAPCAVPYSYTRQAAVERLGAEVRRKIDSLD